VQDFHEYVRHVILRCCKLATHNKNFSHILCIKLYVFIVSDNIKLASLPSSASSTYEDASALVSGFGKTSESKCVEPFNPYSTDKE
jgi:hypothetical protein